MNYPLDAALPIVYIIPNGKLHDLHWESRNVGADLILDENREYIEGYLDGCVEVLVVGGHFLPARDFGHRDGCVQGISMEAAKQLEQVIKKLLHHLVNKRYDELKKAEADK